MTDPFALSSYAFDLPQDRIAQTPAQRREDSRLMVVDKGQGVAAHAGFAELADHLPPGALLVANNTKVLPARLLAVKPTGGAVEFLLLTPLPLLEPKAVGEEFRALAEGLVRVSKKPKSGEAYVFSPDLSVIVLERGPFGRCRVELRWQGDLAAIFERIGHVPLPPYIRRADTDQDRSRYQTLHAAPDKPGSVAAPTAGLHFTPEMRAALSAKGFGWAEVTLHVGYGTFSPVREADIRKHHMHAEFAEISPETAQAVAQAKNEGRPLVAVGTTSARALEGAFAKTGAVAPFRGWTDIFIAPGYRFAVVDAMVTNFHLPGSSLVILVSALAGRETILDAYAQAVEREYRFFSYGDAMLIR
ncbi:tRNA preQ1(34) S-adenosylmethionine ribosyltransferase-isomerase QueA [Fundidesulfovibrio butyratiphilus]